MNVLVISVGPSSFSGIITSPSTVNQLASGIPQLFHIYPNRLLKCSSKITNKDNASVVITPFGSVTPQLFATLPSNPSNIMRSNDGVIVYQAGAADVNQNIQYQLKSPNSSIVSVLFHESINFDTRAVALMSGLPQRDVVLARTSRYFYFTVPPGITGDVKFIVESIEVRKFPQFSFLL
jgi:hypothetical protein